MPVERLRSYYPNLLGLCSEWLLPKEQLEEEDRSHPRHKMDDEAMFVNFLKQITGQEATEDDLRLFRAARSQAAKGEIE